MELLQARHLLESLEAQWPALEDLHRVGEAAWALALTDGTLIAAEWADDPARLQCTFLLGRAPVDRRFVVYETLLTLNALSRDAGGLRLALDGSEGEVLLQADIFESDLVVAPLQDLLTLHADHARAWRDFVTAPADLIVVPMPALAMFALRA